MGKSIRPKSGHSQHPRKSGTNKRVSVPPKKISSAKDDEGVCPVCGGKVVEKYETIETATRHMMKAVGLHCSKCGLRYEFMPPNLKPKK